MSSPFSRAPVSYTHLTGVALGCRVYDAAGITGTTGTITTSYGAVTEFTYAPAIGLFPSFAANVTGGPSPLAVNFTDHSYSSDPGGVTSWAWDLDGDSIIDSTLQNPSFVYTNCGSYNVSLTVTDATHPPSTVTRTAFIRTDRISASFTDQLIAPLVVQFTDTSSMPALSWAWDLDGDNIVDSTVQNPVWVYPNTNPVSVTLTVTRLLSLIHISGASSASASTAACTCSMPTPAPRWPRCTRTTRPASAPPSMPNSA